MKHHLLILIILFIPSHIYPSIWQRKVTNYDRSIYNAGFQNWAIDQNSDGWVYFANTDGLLEFDGVYWNLYPMNNKIVRCIKVHNDKIYVGGSSEFGYFKANKKGLLVYHSLSKNIQNWAGEIWHIHIVGETIYFQDEYYIHIIRNDKVEQMVTSPAKIETSAIINDKLYSATLDDIYCLKDDKSLEVSEIFSPLRGSKLVSLLPYKDEILIITALSGLFTLKNGKIAQKSTIADEFLKENQLFSAVISGSRLVLGSVQNGVYIFDLEKGDSPQQFNLNNGMKNNTVLSTFFDQKGSLWLGMDKGISYVDYNTAIHPLFSTESSIGTGYCSALFEGELYLGTNQGVYKTDQKKKLEKIKGSDGQIWSMLLYDDALFCSGDNGILVITSTEAYKIPRGGVFEVSPVSSDKNKLLIVIYSGLGVLEKKNNRWEFSHEINDYYDAPRGILEDDIANNFWVVNRGAIAKIEFDNKLEKIISSKTYGSDTIKIKENSAYRKIDNNLTFCAEDGIYHYSRITDSFSHYTQLESLLKGAYYYDFLYLDQNKNIWFVHDKRLYSLEYTDKGYEKTPFCWGLHNQLIRSFENVTLVDPQNAIIAIDNGFAKLSLNERFEASSAEAFIRKIVLSHTDSIIAYNNISNLTLPYSNNSINIFFGASNFDNIAETMYTYRMTGMEDDWSKPSTKSNKEYTNLSEGKYIFEVRTLNTLDKDENQTTSIQIEILPPWYRSTLAYVAYAILIVACFFFLYWITYMRQKKKLKQKKEELLRERLKHEMEQKLKDQEIHTLQNDHLRQELHYKTQQLTGYILNVRRNNEILDKLKQNVGKILKAIDENKNSTILKQRTIQLISLINSNIERETDFDVFKSNFDSIHQDFFKILDKHFPQLTQNDKVLCAYLKMNLSSKEIAPLLNITVRGVEISRYRLRKKMQLDRNVNLTEFIQNISTTNSDYHL